MGGPGRHRVCRSCFGPNNVRRLSSVALGGISWNTPPRHRNRLCLHRGPNKVLRMQAQRNPWKAVGLSHRVVTALLTCNTRPGGEATATVDRRPDRGPPPKQKGPTAQQKGRQRRNQRNPDRRRRISGPSRAKSLARILATPMGRLATGGGPRPVPWQATPKRRHRDPKELACAAGSILLEGTAPPLPPAAWLESE